ncbi:MFS transporter [Paenibacillus fonticola]|uniref:MFS transporter n=1 Tax=Paenibacillus fonticola TaxID=379896 RepID=UPI00037B8CE8|nr:MFS transporter [Paenibacillus fonticola]
MSIFKNGKFVFFYVSRTLANVSDSIYTMALVYFVQLMTSSVAYTSFTFALISVASAFSFLMGPIVDRYSPVKLLAISLFAQGAIIFSLPFLLKNDMTSITTVLVLVFIASCFSMLFYPADSKLLPMLIRDSDNLIKANSIISVTDQIVNVLGYLFGAVVIVFLGMHNTFFLSVGMFLLASVVLFRLPRTSKSSAKIPSDETNKGKYFSELSEGFAFIRRSTYLRFMLPFYALTNFAMALIMIIVPSLAVEYGSPFYYSLIYIGFFSGFFIGSILVNILKKKGVTIAFFWVGLGACLSLFALVPSLWLKLVVTIALGICIGVINVMQISFVQIITPPAILGRVSAFMSSFSNAALPVGMLVGGLMASYLASDSIFYISSAIVVASGILLFANQSIRSFDIADNVQEEAPSIQAAKAEVASGAVDH